MRYLRSRTTVGGCSHAKPFSTISVPVGAGAARDERNALASVGHNREQGSLPQKVQSGLVRPQRPQTLVHQLQMVLQHRLAEPRHAHCQHINHQRRSHFCYREKGLVKLNHTAIIIELIVGELVCLLLGFSDVHGHFRLCST